MQDCFLQSKGVLPLLKESKNGKIISETGKKTRFSAYFAHWTISDDRLAAVRGIAPSISIIRKGAVHMGIFNDKYDENKEDLQRVKEVIISTGNINRSYVVRDVVFVAEKFETDLFDPQVDPNESLAGIKLELQKKAHAYGAGAVINCHFDHDHVVHEGKTYLEIFAYGTVVQFIQSTIGG